MKVLLNAAKALTISLVVLFVLDYLSLRLKFPGHREQTGSVDISVYYAIGLKGNKVEYDLGDPETETCAHSLFPQMGYRPCWYVSHHREKWIDIGPT